MRITTGWRLKVRARVWKHFQGRGVGMRREGSRRILSASNVGVHQHQNVDIMTESKIVDT